MGEGMGGDGNGDGRGWEWEWGWEGRGKLGNLHKLLACTGEEGEDLGREGEEWEGNGIGEVGGLEMWDGGGRIGVDFKGHRLYGRIARLMIGTEHDYGALYERTVDSRIGQMGFVRPIVQALCAITM